MNKFGMVKAKLLSKFVDTYSSENKKEMKNLLNVINEDKEFKEMYLLYENIENKYFSDIDTAKYYVEELSKSLNGKSKKLSKTIKKIDDKIGLVETKYQNVYDTLDSLLEEDNILNIESKVRAKIDLVNYLTTKKEISENKTNKFSQNENLLHSVLTNNFNVLYDNTLNEEEKKELKNLLSLSNSEVETQFIQLKESINEKVSTLLNESDDLDLKNKLKNVKEEVDKMSSTRLNYYKLSQLKNGLN